MAEGVDVGGMIRAGLPTTGFYGLRVGNVNKIASRDIGWT